MSKSRVIDLNTPEETGHNVLSEIIGKGARKILRSYEDAILEELWGRHT